jgi:hypothetical protein
VIERKRFDQVGRIAGNSRFSAWCEVIRRETGDQEKIVRNAECGMEKDGGWRMEDRRESGK